MTREPDIIREAERIVAAMQRFREPTHRSLLAGMDNPVPGDITRALCFARRHQFTYDGTQSDPGDEHTPR